MNFMAPLIIQAYVIKSQVIGVLAGTTRKVSKTSRSFFMTRFFELNFMRQV